MVNKNSFKTRMILLSLVLVGSSIFSGCQSKELRGQTQVQTEAQTEAQTEVQAEVQTGEVQRALGKFVAIEQGDYLHLNMEKEDGTLLDFFVLKDMEVALDSLTSGQLIEVTYTEKTQLMDPPGEKLTFLELLSITLGE